MNHIVFYRINADKGIFCIKEEADVHQVAQKHLRVILETRIKSGRLNALKLLLHYFLFYPDFDFVKIL